MWSNTHTHCTNHTKCAFDVYKLWWLRLTSLNKMEKFIKRKHIKININLLIVFYEHDVIDLVEVELKRKYRNYSYTLNRVWVWMWCSKSGSWQSKSMHGFIAQLEKDLKHDNVGSKRLNFAQYIPCFLAVSFPFWATAAIYSEMFIRLNDFGWAHTHTNITYTISQHSPNLNWKHQQD